MGIHIHNLDFFWESVSKAGITSLKGLWLMELGNQTIRVDTKDKYCIRSGYTKVYFLNQRCNHHAIDWNGLDGAVPIDLTEPIFIKRYIKAFEIITDFGCMEHIGSKEHRYIGQWQAWKNIHDMGKVESVYVHTLPLVDSFPGHGGFHYDMDFFKKLCKANDYKILLTRINRHDPRTKKRDYVFTSYVKIKDKPFLPDMEEFKEWLHR